MRVTTAVMREGWREREVKGHHSSWEGGREGEVKGHHSSYWINKENSFTLMIH